MNDAKHNPTEEAMDKYLREGWDSLSEAELRLVEHEMENDDMPKPVAPLRIASEAESLERAEEAIARLVGPPSKESFEYLTRFLAWRYSRKPLKFEISVLEAK